MAVDKGRVTAFFKSVSASQAAWALYFGVFYYMWYVYVLYVYIIYFVTIENPVYETYHING